jgi:hypothetical protein
MPQLQYSACGNLRRRACASPPATESRRVRPLPVLCILSACVAAMQASGSAQAQCPLSCMQGGQGKVDNSTNTRGHCGTHVVPTLLLVGRAHAWLHRLVHCFEQPVARGWELKATRLLLPRRLLLSCCCCWRLPCHNVRGPAKARKVLRCAADGLVVCGPPVEDCSAPWHLLQHSLAHTAPFQAVIDL